MVPRQPDKAGNAGQAAEIADEVTPLLATAEPNVSETHDGGLLPAKPNHKLDQNGDPAEPAEGKKSSMPIEQMLFLCYST